MTHSRNATFSRFAMRPTLRTGLLSAAMLLVIGYAGAQQDNGQGAGGGQGGQPGQGGGRQGQGRGGQGRGGQGGNFSGQLPFSMGTVTGGDPATNVIVIKSQFGGASQTIKVTADTKFVAMSEILVSGLKVGDKVQIQGVPTKITAASISAGELPEALTGGMGGGGRRNFGGPGGVQGGGGGGAQGPQDGANPNGPGPNAQGQAARQQQPQAMASATGKIISKDPLTIALSDEVSIVLKVSDTTKITKIMPASISTIKLGDTILASGTAGADGTFAATGVGINVNMGGMGGRGGFGGGPGGFGGPGGGFNGPGGGGPNGGGGGRRGGRGGGQGANGGGAGATP